MSGPGRNERRAARDHPVRPHRRPDLQPQRPEVLGPGSPGARRSTAPSTSATAAGCASSSASPSPRCSTRWTGTGTCARFPDEVRDQVVDECFQCKLCYTTCPYTAAEGHEFKLDFPRLMLRANAIRRRERGRAAAREDARRPRPAGQARLPHRRTGQLGQHLPAQPGPHGEDDGHPPRQAAAALREPDLRGLGPPRDTAAARRPPTGSHPVVLFATCFVELQPARGRPGRPPRADATTTARWPAPS